LIQVILLKKATRDGDMYPDDLRPALNINNLG